MSTSTPSLFEARVAAAVVEVEAAFASGATPDLAPDRKLWVHVCEALMERGLLGPAEHAMRHLAEARPGLAYAWSMVRIFDAVPEQWAPPLHYIPDPSADVEVIAREGSDTVLLVFCGQGGKVGMPIALAHRWLGRVPASIIYFRDQLKLAGALGYPSLGPDRSSSIVRIRELIRELGASRVLTYGNSSGAFAAVHYGLELSADAALCMAGPMTLSPSFAHGAMVNMRGLERLAVRAPEYAVDLRTLLMKAPAPPRVLYVYGADYAMDRVHAEHIADVSSVELIAIPGLSDHNVVIPSVIWGTYTALLRRLFAAELAAVEG
jgi:hypothetical protein